MTINIYAVKNKDLKTVDTLLEHSTKHTFTHHDIENVTRVLESLGLHYEVRYISDSETAPMASPFSLRYDAIRSSTFARFEDARDYRFNNPERVKCPITNRFGQIVG